MHKIKPQKPKGAQSSPSGPITAPVANKEPFYLAKSPAFAALQTSVKGLHLVADKIPVPGLKEGTKALTFVLDAMQVCVIAIIGRFDNSAACRKPPRTLVMRMP